jgi:hypothetical protein
MRRCIVLAGLLLAPSWSSATFELPAGARLWGSEQVSEVRDFAELRAKHQHGTRTETTIPVKALDRSYTIGQSYHQAVRFFDVEFARADVLAVDRAEVPTATGWSAKLKDGRIAHVIVRNTTPTSIEVLTSAPNVAFRREER